MPFAIPNKLKRDVLLRTANHALCRLKVRWARLGSSRLAFLADLRAWKVYCHGSFGAYTLAGTTTTFRVQVRNLFGREADLSQNHPMPQPDVRLRICRAVAARF